MTYSQIAIICVALALVCFGGWAAWKAERISRRAPQGPLSAPDIVTDNIASCGCAYCDYGDMPKQTSLGMFHTRETEAGPSMERCTRNWNQKCL